MCGVAVARERLLWLCDYHFSHKSSCNPSAVDDMSLRIEQAASRCIVFRLIIYINYQ